MQAEFVPGWLSLPRRVEICHLLYLGYRTINYAISRCSLLSQYIQNVILMKTIFPRLDIPSENIRYVQCRMWQYHIYSRDESLYLVLWFVLFCQGFLITNIKEEKAIFYMSKLILPIKSKIKDVNTSIVQDLWGCFY